MTTEATTTTTDTTAATTTTDTPAAGAFDWKTAGLDEAKLTTVTAKGWRGPADLVDSYVNLEKFHGVPPDQLLKLPRADADPKDWDPVFEKLGRPKEAKEYDIDLPKEGLDEKFVEFSKSMFHEAGLTNKQAKALSAKWNGYAAEAMKAQAIAAENAKTERTTAANAELAKLQAEWGPAYKANEALVDTAAEKFGMNKDQLLALREAMGPAAAMKFMHAIGSKLGVESPYVGGQGPTSFTMTKEQAQAKIAELKANPAWVAKFAKGDVDVRAESKRLHQIAFSAN